MTSAQIYGVPDWHDAGGYTVFGRESSNKVWRWEFLRRRPDYRQEWERWKHNAKPLQGSNHCTAVTDDPDRLRLCFGVSVLWEPSMKMNHWMATQAFYPRTGRHSSSSAAAHVRYGAFVRERLGQEALTREVEMFERRERDMESAALCDYRFDLAAPLGPQIKEAEKELLAEQRALYGVVNTRRPVREYWPQHLRVLDALDAGASYRNIRDVLWRDDPAKTEQSARDACNAARALRDNFPF